MDLKFIWEQAQLAKEVENERNMLMEALRDSSFKILELEEIHKDFKELLSLLSIWSDGTGAYIDSNNAKYAQEMKEKYNV